MPKTPPPPRRWFIGFCATESGDRLYLATRSVTEGDSQISVLSRSFLAYASDYLRFPTSAEANKSQHRAGAVLPVGVNLISYRSKGLRQ